MQLPSALTIHIHPQAHRPRENWEGVVGPGSQSPEHWTRGQSFQSQPSPHSWANSGQRMLRGDHPVSYGQ